MRPPSKVLALLSLSAALSGCGTHTPEIQEFWAGPKEGVLRVEDVVKQVRCELVVAVQNAFNDSGPSFEGPPGAPPPPHKDLKWFDGWGVQIALTLNVIENSAVNAGAGFNTFYKNSVKTFSSGGNVVVPQNLVVAAGAALSSTATRNDSFHFFYKVKDLHEEKLPVAPEELAKNIASCTTPRSQGNLFVESDLKIEEWLRGALLPHLVDVADYRAASLGAAGQNGFSHEVKFEIVTSGNANAVWKLAAVTTNAATLPFFGTSRDRTQDVIITFGPVAKDTNGSPRLASAAENAQFAREIGQAVADALRQPQ